MLNLQLQKQRISSSSMNSRKHLDRSLWKMLQSQAAGFNVRSCTKINYALLTDHDKLYTGPTVKIYERIFRKDL